MESSKNCEPRLKEPARIRRLMPTYHVREEVINVALAELLEQRGLLSIPETIRRSARTGTRQLPDITVAYLLGIRIVIEGRFDSGKVSRDSLLRDAKERVERGISPICLAALYPQELRLVQSLPKLRQQLRAATLEIRVISESSDGEWAKATVDDVADALRHSYDVLISDDVVRTSVEELESAIEFATEVFKNSKGIKEGFRVALGIPAEVEIHADEDVD